MDLKSLIKKRGSHKAKLTQFKTYLQVILSCRTLTSLQTAELSIRLSKIEELYSEFDCTQSEIENLCEIPEEQYKERESFERQYFAAVAEARDLSSRQEASADVGSAAGSGTVSGHKGGPNLKLPTIHLPTFSGNYHDWLEFRDTYTSLIHSDMSIPKISKFHYLRSSLMDSASLIIRSLDLSTENYDIAWGLLCDRYNNKRLLVNNHIQSIFNIQSLSKESAKSLRNIIDTINRNLRALKTLELPVEGWDLLIIHLVSSKMDSVTSREWETHRNTLNELPTLTEFTNFLSNRADLLETMEEAYNNTRRRHSDVTHSRPKVFTIKSHSPPSKQTFSCPLCKNCHAIYQCAKFKSLPIESRIQKAKTLKLCLNCLRQGHNVSTCRLGACRLCNKLHNTLLHINQTSNIQDATQPSPADTSITPTLSHNTNSVVLHSIQPKPQFMQTDKIALTSINYTKTVLLSTALIKINDHDDHEHTVRALLDSGSTSSFITNRLCTKLNLPTSHTLTSVEGLNGQSSCVSKRCDVIISSRSTSYKGKVNCFVVPHITQLLPSTHIDYTILGLPPNITLADPSFHTPAEVDMLLGADLFWSLLCSNNISLGKNKPTLSETKLGWIISGPLHSLHNTTVHCNHTVTQDDGRLHEQLTQFFELETVAKRNTMSKEEEECERHFISTTVREDDGRFMVTIPLSKSPQQLGDSYEQALSRFISLERRFKRDPVFKKHYSQFIKEYIDLGHMTENTTSDRNNCTYIMPHHGVVRETSLTTKLRVVFDASAVTTSGISFNNIQRVGPTIQNDLLGILIRFRQHKYVVTADVEKMYRMINVNPSQRSLQQILWRFQPDEQLKRYKLNTVTYGTASAPYLATRCLYQLGKECEDESVSTSIINDMYVDDYISGHNDASQLLSICRGVICQLKSGKFNLRKWHSNNPEIIHALIGNGGDDELLDLSNHEYAKTLGLLWGCKEDILLFSVNITQHDRITKRTILSNMAQLFDPLGLINPCILQAKIILQTLWSLQIAWDEDIPIELHVAWCKFLQSLSYIKNIKVPRHVFCDDPILCELHIFSDASTQAYGTCVFIRSINKNNKVSVHLVTAKSRVAPLKPTTVPRLELCGALLAARLADKVRSSLRTNIHKIIYWCDSTIVLGWIKSPKIKLLNQFVHNRVYEINTLSQSSSWRYVPTNLNPADIGSRGMDARQIETSSLWWSGPSFLSKSENEWPVQPLQIKDNELPEIKCITTHLNVPENQLVQFIHKFSELNKIQEIMAYILRFIHNCRNPHNKNTSYLTMNELNTSMKTLCKLTQLDTFAHEYNLLKNKIQLSSKNKLLYLSPFLDSDGLMRVGGRLSNSYYDYDTKHPILLHAHNHLAKLIFKHYHKLLLHAGPQLLLANIRHKFWIVNGRNLARKTVHDCVTCCRFSGKVKQPIMGNLPEQRLHAEYPFANTAVDYAGPVMILNRKGRGSRLLKSYLCIFVCLAVRAVHIELVTDLSSETFLAALHRFIARRGKPATIYSDNGTCFVGACNEIARFVKSNSDYIGSYASNLSIKFNFSPAYSPHFNGLAEGAVKSVKHHLKRIIANANLTYEEMNTLLTQIEAVLNSRPLTPLSSDPSDLAALTPSHFLIGRTLTILPYSDAQDLKKLNTLSHYKRVQELKSHFWQRFYKEYITELQKRQRWRKGEGQLQLGEMVLVKDDRLPPNRWLLGRVCSTYPGSDGITRVADIKTSSGTIRRAYNRLCPLPMLEHLEATTQASSASRC